MQQKYTFLVCLGFFPPLSNNFLNTPWTALPNRQDHKILRPVYLCLLRCAALQAPLSCRKNRNLLDEWQGAHCWGQKPGRRRGHQRKQSLPFVPWKSVGHISQISRTSAWLIKSTKSIPGSSWLQQKEGIRVWGNSTHQELAGCRLQGLIIFPGSWACSDMQLPIGSGRRVLYLAVMRWQC